MSNIFHFIITANLRCYEPMRLPRYSQAEVSQNLGPPQVNVKIFSWIVYVGLSKV